MRILLIIMAITYATLSCDKYICNCEVDEEMVYRNDTTINSLSQPDDTGIQALWKRFDEPLLGDLDVPAYRLYRQKAFDGNLKILCVEQKGESAMIRIKEYVVSTPISNKKDSLITHKTRLLEEREWIDLKKTIDENCFWTILTEDTVSWLTEGAVWAVEGYHPSANNCTDRDYHIVGRGHPKKSLRFLRICEAIMALDSK